MRNYYILNSSYIDINLNQLQENIIFLNEILLKKEENETIFMHFDFYKIESTIGVIHELLFTKLPDDQLRQTILPKILSSLKTIDIICESDDDLELVFPETISSFFGINSISEFPFRLIYDQKTYVIQKYNFSYLNKTVFWNKKDLLFSYIKFCDKIRSCKDYFISSPNGEGIIERMRIIELYTLQMNNNQKIITYENLKSETGLNFSPESSSTLQQFSQERTFNLPNGKEVLFSYHIKLGDTRIYFHYENLLFYIPYIGVHLRTTKFKK